MPHRTEASKRAAAQHNDEHAETTLDDDEWGELHLASWDAIGEPGTYVDLDSGDVVRVPRATIDPRRRAPAVDGQPQLVRISGTSYLRSEEAQRRAQQVFRTFGPTLLGAGLKRSASDGEDGEEEAVDGGVDVDYRAWTRAALYAQAREQDIPGRSSMSKGELIKAVRRRRGD